MRLVRIIGLRLVQMVPVALAVIVVSFLLVHAAPGDVSTVLVGEAADPEYAAAVRAKFGLDQPIFDQLLLYLGQVLRGNLGQSFLTHQSVVSMILDRLPATLLLCLTSLVLAAAIGSLIGAYLATRLDSRTDNIVGTAAIGLFSIPPFWLSLMLILVFAVKLGWFPTAGMTSIMGSDNPVAHVFDILWHLVLPVAGLSAVFVGQYIRLARSTVAEAMVENYVTTARAIGYSERQILLRYGLRNSVLPIVTVFGIEVGLALSGAALSETVFAWPGIGRLLYEAILSRDLPVIMGIFIFTSASVMVAALLTDILYVILDPRVEA